MTAFIVLEFQALLPYFQIEFNKHVVVYRLDSKVRQKRRYRP